MNISLDRREHATILAALRYWQRQGQLQFGPEADIASDGATLKPLGMGEIDDLVLRLNTQPQEHLDPSVILLADGKDIGSWASFLANVDNDPELIEDVERALLAKGEATVGGGAQAVIVLTLQATKWGVWCQRAQTPQSGAWQTWEKLKDYTEWEGTEAEAKARAQRWNDLHIPNCHYTAQPRDGGSR